MRNTSPFTPARGRSLSLTPRRTIILSIALVILSGLVIVPSRLLRTANAQRATAQRTAKRTALPGKSSKRSAPAQLSPASRVISQSQTNDDGTIIPGQLIAYPIQQTTEALAAQQASLASSGTKRMPELEQPNRQNLPEGSPAAAASQWPLPDKSQVSPDRSGFVTPSAPQTIGTQFDGATGPTETGAFPPDTMGAVGPTQFVVFLNGRLRTFNKTTGVADGVINADSDVFFASVITPPGAGEVAFTSDPQVRFDRLSNRWFLVIIDVVLNAATGATTKANRVLIAVNDAAS
ncbi:MAG TPA: hypothetical protein VJT50_12475, partial [Pyrinomonadaceae bacterium]|nr:hypothetical protein [Pyrinomonadaceae bacterium]